MPQDKKPSSPPLPPTEYKARSRSLEEVSTLDAEYALGPRAYERDDEAGIDDLPDGDGLRSDLGKNPLPEGYWGAYPDGKPEGEP